MDAETKDVETTTADPGPPTRTSMETCEEPCPIERGMRIVGGKWKGSILWHLKDGPVRFNELARQLGGATRKMVNQRLKELEAQGLVRRQVLSDRPIAVAYEITEFGRSALVVLEQLKIWAVLAIIGAEVAGGVERRSELFSADLVRPPFPVLRSS